MRNHRQHRLPPPLVSILCLLLGTGLATSCTTLSVDEQILAANRTVTLVEASTDAALLSHAITADQAQAVSTIAHQVNPLLDSARAASRAADPGAANKTLQLVNQLLAGLKAYVPPPPPPASK